MEVVSKRQVRLFAIVLVLDGILFSLPNQVIVVAQMDAWLSYVTAMLVVLLALWATAKVMSRFPGKDLFEILTSRFPVAGRAVSLLIVLFIFIMLIRDIRMLTEFVSINLLPNTPLAMISMLVVVSIVYTARGGLEIVARMTEIWLPLMIAILIAIPAVLFPEFDVINLIPLFDRGLIPPLQGSWYAISYMGQLLILPFLFSSAKFGFKDGFTGLAAGTLLILWTNTYIILSMGVGIAGKMLFTLYETVRLIRVTDFLDRFDLPLNLVYLPLLITKVALLLYAVSHGIKRIMPAIDAKAVMGALGVWSFVCSFWFFKNANELFRFNRPWSAAAILCEIVLPCLYYFTLHARKDNKKKDKKKEPGGAPPQSSAEPAGG